MITIREMYTYSWFANLSYVNWRKSSIGSDPVLSNVIEDANDAERAPGDAVSTPNVVDTLGEKIFLPTSQGGEGWHVADFSENDDVGFSATLFANE